MGEQKKQGVESLFVSYEPALDLKELGFDEPCFGFYTPEKQLIIARGDCLQSIIKDAPIVPTFSQAFRWFREKYKMCHWVYQSNDESYFYSILKQGRYLVTNSSEYKTYEEAEIECLKKLIELCKKV